MKKGIILLVVLLSLSIVSYAATGIVKGVVTSKGEPIPGAFIQIKELNNKGAVTNSAGKFAIQQVPTGEYSLMVSCLGFHSSLQKATIRENQTLTIDVNLEEDLLNVDEVVVTGTRYGISTYKTPVIVSKISPALFNSTQSLSLSEGLAFSPGLRVETNCQNCGFSQLRMNGLEGPYSQILINSRPIYSALVGVYGLDMIPTNMIDRIEVVKGGGSALYGGNAIGGTVNIITKDPVSDSFQFGINQAFTDMNRADRTITLNGNIVSDELDKGISIFASNRNRKPWDANDDGFSELTKLENNTFGMDAFWNTSEKSKLKLNMHSINEFRRGGNKFDLQPHETDITEQLDHKIIAGGISFEIYSNDYKHKFAIYTSAQDTKRKSYYGGGGYVANSVEDIINGMEDVEFGGKTISVKDMVRALNGKSNDDEAIKEWVKANHGITNNDDLKEVLGMITDSRDAYYTALNSYGHSKDLSSASGIQYSYDINEMFTLSAGGEYIYNKVDDQMPGYGRKIDQKVNTLGSYVQLEIKPVEPLTLLLGGRYDNVNIDGKYHLGGENFETDKELNVFVPRATIMYDVNKEIKLRASYAQGYRGPQAFDEELHVEAVGGEAVFVGLSPNLKEEKSHNITGSFNYTKSLGDVQTNFVLEGFYTKIDDPFTSIEINEKNGVKVKDKINGDALDVKGANIELNFAYTKKFLAQLGFTFQKSEYKTPQAVWEPEDGDNRKAIFTDKILRTPDAYGFFSFTYKPIEALSLSWSGIYTGKMDVPHVIIPDPEYTIVTTTPTFFENNFKLSYDWDFNEQTCLEVFAGIQNAFNSFQSDFDKGGERDSAYIYGPRKPRTIFMGLKYSFTR